MSIRWFWLAATAAVVAGAIGAACQAGAGGAPRSAPADAGAPVEARANAYTVACYYFPNWHVDPLNERRHGKGWTEWELLRKARPRFPGHRQPRVPAWGYADEADPAVMARKIDAAADAGIDVFLFDWYYYDWGPYLQRALENGFLKAPNVARLKFALMWANHDLVNIFPARPASQPLIRPGAVKKDTWDKLTDIVIRQYFAHPSYWKIDGRPYFSIYELNRLVKNFGSVDATAEALRKFRDKARAAGFPDLHLNAVAWGLSLLPGETAVKNPAELVARLGFDSVTSYVWVHHVLLKEFPQTPYEKVKTEMIAYWHKAAAEFPVPYHPNVTMGWDASPRTDPSLPFTNSGYPYMATMSGNTPEAFTRALMEARRYLDTRPADERILTINAWNEWTEGSYLEPDTEHGTAYLDALRTVFKEDRTR